MTLFKTLFKGAPQIIVGAFFLLVSCDPKKPGVSDPPQAPETSVKASTGNSDPSRDKSQVASEGLSGDVRFMFYNLKNYLTMDIYRKGGSKEKRPKAETEKNALVEIITQEKPDILGVCEIGTLNDLADLQARLKAAGLDFPYVVHAGGMDKTRHQALLSALPIRKNLSRSDLGYLLDNKEHLIRRGILDVLIDLPGGPTHFVGLHLKSKLPSTYYDEAQVRLNEARLARQHVLAILEKDPKARVFLYGDMNDTRKTPPLSAMMGQYRSENYFGDVFLKDSRDHLWTHYWSYQQQYARFDFILASPSLLPKVDLEKSYIVDPPNWFEASDHRALLITIKE